MQGLQRDLRHSVARCAVDDGQEQLGKAGITAECPGKKRVGLSFVDAGHEDSLGGQSRAVHYARSWTGRADQDSVTI